MPVPEYYYHFELLTAQINKLESIYNDLYFVTIQPKEQIFTESEGIAYLDKVFNNQFKGLVQFECNYKITNNSYHLRSTEALPTIHLHLIVDKQYLNQINDIYYYKHTKELKAKRNIHITATQLRYKEGAIKYLSKQFAQNRLPQLYQSFAEVESIYSMTKPQLLINPLAIFQLLFSGITYSEAKQNRYYQLKEAISKGAIICLKRHIKAKKHRKRIVKKYYISPYNIGTKPKPPPLTRTLYV